MRVVAMGDIDDYASLPECGIIIEATHEELGAIDGNIMYCDVEVKPAEERSED